MSQADIRLITLLGYRHDRLCPKCRYMMGTTAYHKGYHGTPCGIELASDVETATRLAGVWIGIHEKTAEDRAREDRRWADVAAKRDSIPEHFDRECPNCKFMWSEGVE